MGAAVGRDSASAVVHAEPVLTRRRMRDGPALQLEQGVAALVSWSYVPGSHAVQEVELAAACVPGLQGTQLMDMPFAFVPGTGEYLPAGHTMHAVLASMSWSYVPPTQLPQRVAPTAAYWP